MPTTGYIEFEDSSRLELTETAASEIQTLLDQDDLEPLAHELFREAWMYRSANPRTSLLLAIVALEVGVKHYIAACVPPATWLVDHAPSPPVVDMLIEYVPTLEPPAGGAPVEPFEEELLRVLRTGVRLWNEIVHTGGANVSSDRLLRTLRAVRNVLWILDAARGRSRAAGYITPSLDTAWDIGYRRV